MRLSQARDGPDECHELNRSNISLERKLWTFAARDHVYEGSHSRRNRYLGNGTRSRGKDQTGTIPAKYRRCGWDSNQLIKSLALNGAGSGTLRRSPIPSFTLKKLLCWRDVVYGFKECAGRLMPEVILDDFGYRPR